MSQSKNIHKFIATILVILVALLLQSCATTSNIRGKPIDQAKVAMIKKGETTSDQILELFGSPSSQSALADNVLYVYQYCVTSGTAFSVGYYTSGSGKESCDELSITFDKTTGKVKASSFQKGVKE